MSKKAETKPKISKYEIRDGDEGLYNWLNQICREQYSPTLIAEGWETIEDLLNMDNEGRKRRIPKPGHRITLQVELNTRKQTSSLKEAHQTEIMSNPMITLRDTSVEDFEGSIKKAETKQKLRKYEIRDGDEGLYNWLSHICLERYSQILIAEGWETIEDLLNMNDDDRERCIPKPGHRKRLQKELYTSKLTSSLKEAHQTEIMSDPMVTLRDTSVEDFEGLVKKAKTKPKLRKYEIRDGDEGLCNWLSQICIEQYSQTLLNEGWETIEDLLNMNNEDLERCIPKPGHRKRLQKELQTRKQTSSPKKAQETEMTSDPTVTLRDESGKTECKLLPHLIPFNDKNNRENTFTQPAGDHSEHLKNTVVENRSKTADKQSCDELETTETTDNTVDAQLGIVPMCESSKHTVCNEHSLEGSVAKTLLKTTSCSSSFTTATIMNAEEVTNFDNCTIIQAETGTNEKYKNQMKCVKSSYQQDDRLFIETKAYQELKDIVEDCHWALIVGIPGDGKTAMAIHLCLQYNKRGHVFVQIHSAQEWKDFIGESNGADNSQKQVIFIDNMFGEMNVDKRKARDWKSVFPFMQRVVNSRDGDLKIVCTTKKCIFIDVDLPVDKFPFCAVTNVVDLTLDCYSLSSEEKQDIWNMYADKYRVTTKKPRCISGKRRTPHGYPLCVVQFCTNSFLQREGVAFFENPTKYICREIKNFMKNDRNRYFVLILILLNNNRMLERDLFEVSGDPEKFKDIANAAGLSPVPTKDDMEFAVNGLKNMYISDKYDGWVNISHDSVRENLANIYIGNTPKHAIENIDFTYLVRHTKWPRWNLKRDKSQHDLSSSCQVPFIHRILREIKDGNVVRVCEHEAWENTHFNEKTMKTILQTDHMSIIDIFKAADTSHPTLKKMDLINSLKYFQRKRAVACFEENYELQKILKGKPSSLTQFELVTDNPTNTLTADLRTQAHECAKESDRKQGTAIVCRFWPSMSPIISNVPPDLFHYPRRQDKSKVNYDHSFGDDLHQDIVIDMTIVDLWLNAFPKVIPTLSCRKNSNNGKMDYPDYLVRQKTFKIYLEKISDQRICLRNDVFAKANIHVDMDEII